VQSWKYEGQKVLVLAPHADDETIGCGGTIQKYLKCGSSVRIVIASFVNGKYPKFKKEMKQYEDYSGTVRMKELEKAFQILGITDYHFMYMDKSTNTKYHSKLDTIPRFELVQMIEGHIQNFCPTIIYIPSITKHQDHEYLYDAAMTATRPYFWNGSVIAYETDGEFSFQPNLFVSLTEEEINTKVDALRAYQTQVGAERHPVHPNFLLTKATYRAQSIYENYAEAFQIIRLHG
jgi:N-acetylglucosamine malate deacetylase 1